MIHIDARICWTLLLLLHWLIQRTWILLKPSVIGVYCIRSTGVGEQTAGWYGRILLLGLRTQWGELWRVYPSRFCSIKAWSLYLLKACTIYVAYIAQYFSIETNVNPLKLIQSLAPSLTSYNKRFFFYFFLLNVDWGNIVGINNIFMKNTNNLGYLKIIQNNVFFQFIKLFTKKLRFAQTHPNVQASID